MKRRIAIAAGGTGGHLYPAQALAEELQNQFSSDVLFIAAGLGTSRYFDRTRFQFLEVCSSPLSAHPIKCLKGISTLLKGTWQSIAFLKKYNPHAVVGFGSYYAIPTILAARYLKIPIILHEANSIPGRTNRHLAPLATYVGVHFPSTARFFKTKAIEVGLPLRQGYQLESLSKESALAYYGLKGNLQTLLICGGSQGAQAINDLMRETIPFLKDLGLQVIHLTGNPQSVDGLASIYAQWGIAAVVKPFEKEMQMAWRAADAFIGRSGASTIAESIAFEVPGLLIPYPYATDHHQEKNADFLVENVGSAWKLLQNDLSPALLLEKIRALFESKQYLFFKKALSAYKQRPNKQTLCQLLLSVIRQ